MSVFAADLDGDEDYDLAVANNEYDSVSVLLNNGDGTFSSVVSFAAGDSPRSVFANDFDGDYNIDLAVANEWSDNISILLNNGDGTFCPPVYYETEEYEARPVFSADFDGDNDNDLAVSYMIWHIQLTGGLSILLNNGDGSFSPRINYPVDGPGLSVFSADFDGDDDYDLAIGGSILLDNGIGTFSSGVEYVGGSAIFSTDFDGDDDNDLAVVNPLDCVSILLNNGDGTFGAEVPLRDWRGACFSVLSGS